MTTLPRFLESRSNQNDDPWTGELLVNLESVVYRAPGSRSPTKEVCLQNGPVVVGRSPDSDIKLNDQWSSRVHCAIVMTNGKVAVRDLESTHGTHVNGEKIESCILHDGDELVVGTTRLVISVFN